MANIYATLTKQSKYFSLQATLGLLCVGDVLSKDTLTCGLEELTGLNHRPAHRLHMNLISPGLIAVICIGLMSFRPLVAHVAMACPLITYKWLSQVDSLLI